MIAARESPGVPRVLIADDDASTRVIMREVLEQAGFNVVEAADGKEALELFETAAPDVVLLDVEMPHVDGFGVCEAIRSQETNRNTPICIVTGLDDEQSVDRAYNVGATDFIGKPIAWPVLGHRVRYILRATEALNDIRGLISALPDTVFILDKQGRTRDCVTEGVANVASNAGTLGDFNFEDIITEEDSGKVHDSVGRALESGAPQVLEHDSALGSEHFETRFVPRDSNSILAIVRDVTDRRRADLQIRDLAYYDQLTGLPNRQLFSEELESFINTTEKPQQEFTLLFVDLDHFKRINDTLGHSMGDELLKGVAARLQGCLRSADHVVRADQDSHTVMRLARLGGDEFVVTLRDVGSKEAAAAVASRIVDALSQPFTCGGHQFVVTPSIGIAVYPQDGDSYDELVMNADSAMYRAKAAGRNTYKFYSETMKVRSLHRLEIENDLRRAIGNGDLELHYQPKVDLSSWTIVGAEALLRWKHEERGWISPAEFVPIAEETGLILPLGAWVLQTACEQLRKWGHSPLNKISVSVNVSSQQVFTGDLVGTVKQAVSDARIQPEMLDLEITESLMMRDIESTIQALKTLRDFGVTLSVDDFGTGYSSLSYLKRFPITALKIDRSFVRDLHRDPNDAAICSAILAMARSLDLEVIAEGVELNDQLEFLRRENCDQIQGFYFSKPLPAGEFETLFLTHLDFQKIASSG